MHEYIPQSVRGLVFRTAAIGWRRRDRPKPRRTTARLRALLDAEVMYKPLGITCAGKTDGPGAQIQAKLSTLCFCRTYAIPYVHSPMTTAAHVGDADELQQWEELFGLGTGEMHVGNDQEVISLEEFVASPHRWHTTAILRCEHLHHFVDSRPGLYETLRPELRRKYTGALQNLSPNVKIAVHIRRGDVSQKKNQNRFTPLDYSANILQQVLAQLGPDRARAEVAIYSQGSPVDFKPLADRFSARLFLDSDPIWTLQQLVEADVLVTAKSTFSYIAGLISTGMVIYEPFWHQPLPSWIVPHNTAGSLPSHRLAEGLRTVTHARR